jgi:hypothetical protein
MGKKPVSNFNRMKDDFSILKLKEEIIKRTKIANDALLNNDIATAQANMIWVKTANSVISQTRKTPGKVKWAIITGLISIILIGLGFIIHLPSINIAADIETKTVHFKLRNEWVLQNRFSIREVNITNLKEVYAAGANIKITKDQAFNLHVTGNGIVLDKLMFSSGADITIQLQDNTQDLIIKNDTLVTRMQVGKAQINIDDGVLDTAVNFEVPETFNIRSFPAAAIPTDITLADTTDWSFRDMVISNIDFLEESVPGSGKFISSINLGNIKVLETGKETDLQEGDWLLLDNLKNRRFQITKSASGLKIHIEGEVAKASSGSELFERQLNPSIIEYLYYAKSFAFFWSAIVFLFSLTWSLRSIIFSNES